MKEEHAVEQAARELRDAYMQGSVAPIAPRLIPNTVAAGYAVQEVNTRHWVRQGRRIVGAKIGLTSAAVRAQIGVEEPDFGILFADMQVEDGATISTDRLSQPRIEAEIAFGIGSELSGSGLTRDTVAAATAWIAPAIEIVASRIEGWRCAIADTVADNASAGLFVVGAERIDLDPSRLPSLAMSLTADGQPVSTGVGAASMGNPLDAVLWLANMLADLGRPLQEGDIVLSGALGPLIEAAPEIDYVVEIETLGRAAVRFSA